MVMWLAGLKVRDVRTSILDTVKIMKRKKTELCKKAYLLGNMGKDISNQPGAGA